MKIDTAAIAIGTFVNIGLVGVVTSVAQYAVRTYPESPDMRMWLVIGAFTGYMLLLTYITKRTGELIKGNAS